jgi:apolipoprotein D and lipocalin family protein
MFNLRFLIIINCLVVGSYATKCPDISVYPNLDPTKYFGTWYEIERFFDPFEADLKCVAAHYSPKDDGKILVNNTGVDILSNKFKFRSGEAYAPDPNVSYSVLKLN